MKKGDYSYLCTMKKMILALALSALALFSVSCIPQSDKPSIQGEWAMTSGSTKIGGAFTVLDVHSDGTPYKTMTFYGNGIFTATAKGFATTGTYKVISSSSIRFTYDAIPEGAPEWFAFRKSGTWNYTFLSEDVFWFYDYGSSVEVAMTMERVQ